MQFSMTGQEKRDLLIQVTAWAGLTVQWNLSNPTHQGTREMCRIVQDVGKLRFSF